MSAEPCGALTVRRATDHVYVTMLGELDLSVITAVHVAAVEGPQSDASVDMTAVTFFDATGLSFLIALHRSTTNKPQLVGVPQNVTRLLHLTGTHDLFRVSEAPHHNVDELAAQRRKR